ncbi:MAG: (2Fe-2S) ferredoxin domain-containing protein [Candidatus Sericytochromatia bacterium]|nr:(2Fe-2S) ferredoxin domain-containing protein [Candidatus Tanganyikabacteria bacterium]
MPRPHHQILVCTNERPPENPKGSCKPKGALDLFQKLKEAVHARGIRKEVWVNQASCLRSCPFGPTVAVWPEGAIYGGMTPDRVDALLDSVERGEIVADWLVPEGEIGQY